ncbi:class I SAM-dependent methyltransferase [Polaribacter batillariae]|uniref:Class I SAM-dependent methyltransferase n=1 Tax=Polaribacter batillariae TaxID=2808900 RepID=A0ABX7STK3_9FLAO|nr:class I SAM-dependent methyltransferase [Polaribacter batillariae]QTD37565.1 class I SAM-dependent methyltransferase [Polaribacter batillariae]
MFAEDKAISDLKSIDKIVECISEKKYSASVVSLINFCENLPNNNFNNYLKISCIPFLFHSFENIINKNEDPAIIFDNILKELKNNLEETIKSSFDNIFETSQDFIINEENEKLELETGDHYGNLFKGFTPDKYFNETKELLKKRLEINNIDISNIHKYTVLDQGCGGGRYSVAWALLGAKKVVGIDISKIGINDAVKRAKRANIQNVEYKIGNVLDLPFQKNEFDIVFSNGVLHHTKDWKKGISEQLRVLKPDGLGWQYLIEQPGGIFWDKIEILRMIVRNINKNFAIKVLSGYGISTNRIFYMLDHVMVPINTRITPEELKMELEKNGAKDVRRLTRGLGFDRIEYIHKEIPYAKMKFGVGENRFIFTK